MRKIALMLIAPVLPLCLTSCIVMQITPPQAPAPAAPGPVLNIAFETLDDDFSSIARNWDAAEIRAQVAGRTFLRNFPKVQNEILFFGEDGKVYQWLSGTPYIASSAWQIAHLKPTPQQKAREYICMSLQYPPRAHAAHNNERRCIEPAMLFIPTAERAKGDVFFLAKRTVAPAALPVERTSLEAIVAVLNRQQAKPSAPRKKRGIPSATAERTI